MGLCPRKGPGGTPTGRPTAAWPWGLPVASGHSSWAATEGAWAASARDSRELPEAPALDRAGPWEARPVGQEPRAGRGAHLDVAQLHLGRAALHLVVVAAAGAALHLHAGRPHQVVGVAAVDEAAGDLEHLGADLALGYHGWLGDRGGI